jgi:DNA excision repair protein ERCC-4
MHILVDTREQHPYTFARFEGVTLHPAGLESGDYSLPGHDHLVAIERKTLDDLIGCLTTGRERFERELHRLRPYLVKAVVVEATLEDVARGRYRSGMNAQSALQSILAFMVRYSIPFVFAGTRAGGEYVTHGLLWKFCQEQEKRFKALADIQQ